jgi:hypothetical protein
VESNLSCASMRAGKRHEFAIVSWCLPGYPPHEGEIVAPAVHDGDFLAVSGAATVHDGEFVALESHVACATSAGPGKRQCEGPIPRCATCFASSRIVSM